ncbi:MAG: AMP-binding protein [Roseiarcus sp.]
MGQSHIRGGALIDRLETLASTLGGHLAQSYVASGDPDADPRELTFAQLVGDVRRRSNALSFLGVAPSDVIAFAAPLSETSYPMLVAGMITGTLAPVNYFLEADALIRILGAQGATVLLVHRSFDDGADILDRLKRVHEALPSLRFLSFGVGPAVEGATDIESVAIAQSASEWITPARNRSRDHVVALFHTGGTTGLPKLAPHTEAMYDAMLASCGAGEGTAPAETMLSGLPLFHTSGALQAGVVPLFNGTRLVIPSTRGFRDPKVIANYWRFVRRYSITIGAGVPTVLAALTAIEPDGPISSLKRIVVGGAPIARATIGRIAELTNGAEVVEGWGMTETCGFSVMNPHGRTKVGSVGIPFTGVETEIRKFVGGDEVGQRCAVDEAGELVVRGDIVIKSYFVPRRGSHTRDGWLRTGDQGRIDADGYLWITGRLKDIIIRNGHNIDPAVIEEPACQHPAVQLAAAVGRPDKYAGELPVLYVQLKPGASAAAEEIEAFVRERFVERAAAPKAVHIVAEIPLSGVGKISKLKIRRAAIAAVFQEEIDRLPIAALKIRARTEEDSLAGERVVLSCEGLGPPDADRRQMVAQALEGYTVPYRWDETGGAA